MNKKTLLLISIAAISLLLILGACSRTQKQNTKDTTTSNQEGEIADNSVDQEVNKVDKLVQDLSTDELDNIDKYLVDADSLE